MKIAIVGAGLYGATVAAILSGAGHQVTVFEAEEKVGGNIRDEWSNEAKTYWCPYGAHIFHTNSDTVWDFVNKYSAWKPYRHYVKGQTDDKIIDLPFGMAMFSQLLDLHTPADAKYYFDSVKMLGADLDQSTIEGWCYANIGHTLYVEVVKDYTEKQWGRPCSQLPASIVRRLPMRFTYDTTYFHNAKYEAMPADGYSRMINSMLTQSITILGCPMNGSDVDALQDQFDHTFFSGSLDTLMGYHLGELSYRGLNFVHQTHPMEYWNGAPVINDLRAEHSYTRVIEHKLLCPSSQKSDHTIISTEYPADWKRGDRAYYPLRDDASQILHQEYVDDALERWPRLTVGGRLGAFQYMDMDQVVGMGMKDSKKLLGRQDGDA